MNWLFNEIPVIYVTVHRCAGGLKKKMDLRSGSQHHRHFVEFFNVPVLAPTRGHPFYTAVPRNCRVSHLVAFYDTLWIRRTHSRLYPRVLKGEGRRSWGSTKTTWRRTVEKERNEVGWEAGIQRKWQQGTGRNRMIAWPPYAPSGENKG